MGHPLSVYIAREGINHVTYFNYYVTKENALHINFDPAF
jgi:hypothetical protein